MGSIGKGSLIYQIFFGIIETQQNADKCEQRHRFIKILQIKQLFHNIPCLISQNVVSFFGLITVVSDLVFSFFPHTISHVTKYYKHQIKAILQPSFHIF